MSQGGGKGIGNWMLLFSGYDLQRQQNSMYDLFFNNFLKTYLTEKDIVSKHKNFIFSLSFSTN